MRTTTTRQPADYTEGSVLSSILKMGLPSMFGFLAQHVYAMADMFWVSRLDGGEAGVAAITFFNNMMWLVFAFNHLVGPGSVAVISRRYGEKDYLNAEKAIKETLLLKLGFGIPLAILGWIFLPELLSYIGAEGEALSLGIVYGRIMLVGLPIMFTTYSVFTALRGVANPNLAMGLMLGSNVLNVVLDPLLMFGYFGLPAWGIRGAAIASVASFTLTLIVGVLLFTTPLTNVRLRIAGAARLSLASAWKIVRIGIPAWLGELSWSGSRLLLTPIIATFGTPVVAAYGVGTQWFAFGIMILVGIGLGLSSLIGHNIGGGKLDRAKKTADQAIMLSVGIMTLLGVLTFLFARQYVSLFFKSEETIGYAVEILRIFALGYPFFGVFIMLENIHSGVGLNTPMMVFVSIHSWGFQVLPSLLVTQVFGWDQNAVWIVLATSGCLTSTLFYLYYRRGKWLTVSV
ncbi:MATE family efflux transporter [bacterium]|nr:MATE family efflux transporter [bacterium]MCB2201938.1 MATE family efflux transporter [bacterium]